MPTQVQYDSLRYDFDLTDDQITDEEIDGLYTRAEAKYPDSSSAQDAGVRLLVINALLMQAAKRSDYVANRSEEKLSQVFDHLLKLRKLFADDLRNAIDEDYSGIMFGGLRRREARIMEYPVTDYAGLSAFADRYWMTR